MTAPTPFAARLRALSKDASPGPWKALLYKVGHDFEPPTCIEPNINCGNGYDGEIKADDCRLIIYLRNHADRLADLVERVAQYRAATREANKAPTLEAMGYALHRADVAKDAIFAALDALDGGGA